MKYKLITTINSTKNMKGPIKIMKAYMLNTKIKVEGNKSEPKTKN